MDLFSIRLDDGSISDTRKLQFKMYQFLIPDYIYLYYFEQIIHYTQSGDIRYAVTSPVRDRISKVSSLIITSDILDMSRGNQFFVLKSQDLRLVLVFQSIRIEAQHLQKCFKSCSFHQLAEPFEKQKCNKNLKF